MKLSSRLHLGRIVSIAILGIALTGFIGRSANAGTWTWTLGPMGPSNVQSWSPTDLAEHESGPTITTTPTSSTITFGAVGPVTPTAYGYTAYLSIQGTYTPSPGETVPSTVTITEQTGSSIQVENPAANPPKYILAFSVADGFGDACITGPSPTNAVAGSSGTHVDVIPTLNGFAASWTADAYISNPLNSPGYGGSCGYSYTFTASW